MEGAAVAGKSTKLTAKDVLIEACDKIEATYWVQGAEFKRADENTYAADQLKISGQKFIPIVMAGGYNTLVTGVCSVGAISLAVATRTKTPLTSFEDLARRDPATYKAGEALADVLRAQSKWKIEASDTALDTIANWNDDENRTRAQVVKAFKKALESPKLTAKNIYTITYGGMYDEYTLSSLTFASKGEADEFVAKLKMYVVKRAKRQALRDINLKMSCALRTIPGWFGSESDLDGDGIGTIKVGKVEFYD